MNNHNDHQARASEITDIDEFDLDTKAKARYVVAGHSESAQECVEFWSMLGIAEDSDAASPGLTQYAIGQP